jgi:hypothetical protein
VVRKTCDRKTVTKSIGTYKERSLRRKYHAQKDEAWTEDEAKDGKEGIQEKVEETGYGVNWTCEYRKVA